MPTLKCRLDYILELLHKGKLDILKLLNQGRLKKNLEDEGKLSDNAINYILYDVHRSNLITR